MFGMGMPELIGIAAIAIFLFGAKKLPEVASGLGKAIKSFRKEMKEVATGLDTVEHQSKQQH